MDASCRGGEHALGTYQRRPVALHVVSDERSGYDPGGRVAGRSMATEPAPPSGSTEVAAEAAARSMADLEAIVASTASVDLDELPDDVIEGVLRRLQPQINRLVALRSRAAGALEHRRRVAAGPGREQRARQDARRFLRDELKLTPGEAKRSGETGRRLSQRPASGAAFGEGKLNEDQATVVARTLGHVAPEQRDEVERQLLTAAAKMDAIALGREARRLVASHDPASARRQERRQHLRRAFSLVQTDDGAVVPRGRLYGLQAERAMTAWLAFMTPDAPRDERSPEQRGADAFDAMVGAALDAGTARTQHGARPHVLVVVTWSDLALQAGVAELGFTGPVTMAEIRPLLRDCTVSRVVLGPESTPIEVSEKVRTVPAGLWRALLVRDGGCTWRGCDRPASWCDVAHGQVPYANDGRLHLSDCALLCRHHHRRFDAGGWRLRVDGNAVSYERVGAGTNSGAGGHAGDRAPP